MAVPICFQVSTRNSGRLRTIQVCVYDSAEELRKAGRSYEQHCRYFDPKGALRGSPEGGWDNIHGLVQSCQMLRVYKSGRVRRLPSAGHMRFYRDQLGTGIIAHETAHMAVAIYEEDIGKTIPDMKREEKLCYLVGDIAQRIVDKLYKLKLLERKG